MSVLPLKADFHKRGLHVRLVPATDIRDVRATIAVQAERHGNKPTHRWVQPVKYSEPLPEKTGAYPDHVAKMKRLNLLVGRFKRHG
jgi:hypothetical protein